MASALMTPVLCEICSFTPAKFYCNTCQIALCRTCILQHLMSQGSTHHHIVLYSEKLNPKYLASLSCDTHLNKSPEFWCQTCLVPSCVSCISAKHKGHQYSYITIMLSRKRDEMVGEAKNLRETEFLEQMFGQLSRLLGDNPSVQYQFSVDTGFCPLITCVDQGRAWVATWNKLQLMDRSGSVKDKIKINFDIYDMALTSDGELLLADNYGRCIKSVSRKKKITALFSTSWEPWGLSCLHNDDIVVAFRYERKVIIYSRDGEIRNTLDNIEFRWPHRVAVNKVIRTYTYVTMQIPISVKENW